MVLSFGKESGKKKFAFLLLSFSFLEKKSK